MCSCVASKSCSSLSTLASTRCSSLSTLASTRCSSLSTLASNRCSSSSTLTSMCSKRPVSSSSVIAPKIVPRSLVHLPVLHHVDDVPQRGHVRQRIAIDDDDVRELARRDGAEVRLLEELCWPVRRGADGVHRRHAEVHHRLELAPCGVEVEVERDAGVGAQ